VGRQNNSSRHRLLVRRNAAALLYRFVLTLNTQYEEKVSDQTTTGKEGRGVTAAPLLRILCDAFGLKDVAIKVRTLIQS